MEWSFMLLRWLISSYLYTVDFFKLEKFHLGFSYYLLCVLLYATAAQIDGV